MGFYSGNSTYSQLSPCGHPAITDKIQIPICKGLTENDSRHYGLRYPDTKRRPEGVHYNESWL